MLCLDLGESFPTSIYLQNLASIPPRTSPVKFARSVRHCRPLRAPPPFLPSRSEQQVDDVSICRPAVPTGTVPCCSRRSDGISSEFRDNFRKWKVLFIFAGFFANMCENFRNHWSKQIIHYSILFDRRRRLRRASRRTTRRTRPLQGRPPQLRISWTIFFVCLAKTGEFRLNSGQNSAKF